MSASSLNLIRSTFRAKGRQTLKLTPPSEDMGRECSLFSCCYHCFTGSVFHAASEKGRADESGYGGFSTRQLRLTKPRRDKLKHWENLQRRKGLPRTTTPHGASQYPRFLMGNWDLGCRQTREMGTESLLWYWNRLSGGRRTQIKRVDERCSQEY